MGILQEMLGSGTALSDKDIAADMLKDSKFDLIGLTLAISESTNSQLRQILTKQFNECANDHFKLSNLAINNRWYPAYQNPMRQMQTEYRESQRLTQNLPAAISLLSVLKPHNFIELRSPLQGGPFFAFFVTAD